MHITQAVRWNYLTERHIRQSGLLAGVSVDDHGARLLAVRSAFWQQFPSSGFQTAEEAFKVFCIWFSSYNDTKEGLQGMATMVKVTFSLTKHYGSASVTLGLESQVEAASGADLLKEWEKLQALVHREHEQYEQAHLQELRSSAEAAFKRPVGGDPIECLRISVKVENGKYLYRAHGGNYKKFGVPLYPEAMEGAGLAPEDIPLEGLETPGATMIVDVIGNRPVRVARLDLGQALAAKDA